MSDPKANKRFFLFKYLSNVEVFGWALCIFSMLTIIFSKEIAPHVLPFAWIGAIAGAAILGWGMGRNRKPK
ncbi:hypothetical protein [Paraglaciecola aestuariivivens]